MENKRLISIEDYKRSENVQDLEYYRPTCISAREYVTEVSGELNEEKGYFGTFRSVKEYSEQLSSEAEAQSKMIEAQIEFNRVKLNRRII